MIKENCFIVGVKNDSDNRHTSKNTGKITQVTENQGYSPEIAFCDRGFRGVKNVGKKLMSIPQPPKKNMSNC